MKRSSELTSLSHDHHQALFVAMGLKRAVDAKAGEPMIAYFDAHGRSHFALEEDVLLPAWLELDPNAERERAARVLDEHLRIRLAVRRLRRGTLSLAGIRELGELLEAHVRFEERELFPQIESGLAAGDLAQLGTELAAAESAEG